MIKLYNIAEKFGRTEINAAIVNEKTNAVILTDNEACHTVHKSHNRKVLLDGTTVDQILTQNPVGEIDNLGNWIQKFGNRLEYNYRLLLKSIQEIGLNPADFPRGE